MINSIPIADSIAGKPATLVIDSSAVTLHSGDTTVLVGSPQSRTDERRSGGWPLGGRSRSAGHRQQLAVLTIGARIIQ